MRVGLLMAYRSYEGKQRWTRGHANHSLRRDLSLVAEK